MKKATEKILLNKELVDHMKDRAIAALRDEAYIETAVIMFQINEQLLRICIEVLAVSKNVSKNRINECAWTEIGVTKLINYLELLKPNTAIPDRFAKYNNERNKIMHKLFFSFDSISAYKDRLKIFCGESLDIQQLLMDFITEISASPNK